MSPRWHRRRARRRSRALPVVALIGGVVVLALLVGGLTQVSSQSHGYDVASDRTLAAQGAVVADQSNATSTRVRALMNDLSTQDRQALQVALDDAVEQTGAESARARFATGATASGALAAQLAAVFAERAQSVAELRTTLDDFVGMEPFATAGAPSDTASSGTASSDTASSGTASSVTASSDTASPAVLSATQATNRIAAAGALLARSDALYRAVRRTLAAAPGGSRLPRSVWVTDPQLWSVGTVAAQVDLVATSPTLAASHYVVLRTVRLSPPALPSAPNAAAGVSVISPTTSLSVTAVVANQGSSDEPQVRTTFTLADQAAGTTLTRTKTVALGLDASLTVPTVTFPVKPGKTYLLTVEVVPPTGQSLTAGTAIQQPLEVAPAT